jgi:hypothetical protein
MQPMGFTVTARAGAKAHIPAVLINSFSASGPGGQALRRLTRLDEVVANETDFILRF